VGAKFSGGRSRVSRHGRHRSLNTSTVLLDSSLDTKPVGGFEPHYFRRLSLQIGAAYVILVLGAFAAVGFGLRSSEPRSAPPVHIPPVLFPTTSPAQTVTASPGTTVRASAAPSVTLPAAAPSVTVSPVAASSAANAAPPTVSVIYVVVTQYDGQFEGEVTVENNGSAQISGWQIVVALPADQITSFSNASGYVSNNILVLQPAYSAETIAAGGTLSVYFTAVGSQTTPAACAFNSIVCG
jgi:Cellulose binding domain